MQNDPAKTRHLQEGYDAATDTTPAERAEIARKKGALYLANEGYPQFVADLLSPPENYNFDVTVLLLLVDQLKALNNASLALDHLKRVITYGEKLRMNPCPMARSVEVAGALGMSEVFQNIHGLHKEQDVEGAGNGMRQVHALLGNITEALEQVPILLELLATGGFDGTNLIEELGDVGFYSEEILRLLGESRQGMRQANVRKLAKRYQDLKFSHQGALVRDLDAERVAIDGAEG